MSDSNRPTGRRPRFATLSLSVLAAVVVGAAAMLPMAIGSAVAKESTDQKHETTAKAPVTATRVPDASASACMDGRIHGTFSGTISDGAEGSEISGTHEGTVVLQHRLGTGQWLCARAHRAVRFDERDGSILALPRGSWVQVETRDGRRSQRMLVTEEGGQHRYQWFPGGKPQILDADARAWLADALEAVAGFRAIGEIRGQVGSLHGEIGSIHGEVGSLRGQIGSIRGEEGSLRGKLGSIRGEEGSLRGSVGSHQGAIGALQGSRWNADSARRAEIDREIAVHEREIRKLEAEMESRKFPARIAAAEAEIRTFVDSQAKGRIQQIEKQIEDVRAEERVAKLKRQIEDLHADDRIAEIERRMKPVLERLKGHIDRLSG
jgi:hypothetical protein